MNRIFEENISNYNVFRLAEWIKKCRSAVQQSDRASYQESYSNYAWAVSEFCKEWVAHYEANKPVYESAVYREALLYLALCPAKCSVKAPEGDCDITDGVMELLREDEQLYNITQSISGKESRRLKDYKKQIDSFLKGERKQLSYLISELKEAPVRYTVSVTKSEGIFVGDKSVPELLTLLGRRKLLLDERKRQVTASETYSSYIRTKLKEAQIGKNAYYSYIDPEDKSSCKKVFCTNLAFFLGLSISDAQRLYINDGYSICGSKREADQILATCFTLGCPIEYADALLFRGGYPTLSIERAKRTGASPNSTDE